MTPLVSHARNVISPASSRALRPHHRRSAWRKRCARRNYRPGTGRAVGMRCQWVDDFLVGFFPMNHPAPH